MSSELADCCIAANDSCVAASNVGGAGAAGSDGAVESMPLIALFTAS